MLAKPNRVLRGEDFRATMRRGNRTATKNALVYIAQRAGTEPARFGFVVSKAVGNSVTRNRIRRRLRAVSAESLAAGVSGVDIVVRPLAGSAALSWATLHEEIGQAIVKGTRR